MKNLTLSLTYILLFVINSQAQEDIIYTDYMTFGRKEPASLGTVFSALGNEPVFVNPANVAIITDNRITVGGSFSDLGDSYMLSWTTPNLSICSAMHRSSLSDSVYDEYRKELLKLSFAISTEDIGYQIKNTYLSLGVAIKRLSDKVYSAQNPEFGGDALSIDLGFNVYWKYMTFEIAMLNVNQPSMGDTELAYTRALSFVTRYRSPSGFVIAFQGINSSTYAGSDIGINLAAEQSFLNQSLVSRLQLTSFFSGTEATMQNISGGIGYRPNLSDYLIFLQDIEFSYTLSFLATPKNIGTHMLVITKYF